jgi:hypothetical protein
MMTVDSTDRLAIRQPGKTPLEGWRNNGRGEIRTPETGIARLPVFKTGAFNRSATLPTREPEG